MAVGAHWAQIIDGVEFILLTNFRQRLEMVDVNETFSQHPIVTHEVKPANDARDTPISYTFAPSIGIALIDIDSDRLFCTFKYLLRLNDLLGENFWMSHGVGCE